MHLVTYQHAGEVRSGVLNQTKIIDLKRGYRVYLSTSRQISIPSPEIFDELKTILQSGQTAFNAIQEILDFVSGKHNQGKHALESDNVLIPLKKVQLLPPIPEPGKIICVGMNYPPSGGGAKPNYPVLFLKASSTLTGAMSPIMLPKTSQAVYSEGELAVIIGKQGKYITPDNAMNYVGGYTIANDVTARDIEQRTSQWQSGKLADTFTPMGPAIVTTDEIPDPHNLAIHTAINGKPTLSGNTRQMYFNIPYLIAYISTLCTLTPGDIVLTGSPKQLAGNLPIEQSLVPGDVISIEIDHLGCLSNPVQKEQ